MANAVFEPFFASLRSNWTSFTNCLRVCTDGATRILKRINEVEVRTLHGQVFTPSWENLFPEKDPSLRSSGQPVWSQGINSSWRTVLQIKSAAFDDGGALSKVHIRMWTHIWEYTAFSLSKAWQHSNTTWESQSVATDLSTSKMADRGPANKKDRLTGMCIIRRGNGRWGQINNHGDGQADRHRYE